MTPMDQYQPSLFAETLPAPRPELVELAGRLPPSVRFGTSTWTYDGWAGDVYHRRYRGAQPARRLEEYVRYPLFRTVGIEDRKSTRLNSSHLVISYAVFCLKKKKTNVITSTARDSCSLDVYTPLHS